MRYLKRFDSIVTILWVSVSLFYLWRWEVFFNSDFAIVGLTALESLRSGAWFIFIPSTGYQGLLLCNTATALFYQLFGPAPWVLNLWPTLVFLALLPIFRYAVSLWHGARVASFSSLVLLLSPPLFHHLVLRSHPNLGEVLVLGCCLFVLLHRQSPVKLAWARCFCIGLTTGFGVYLAGQFLFFAAAAVLSVVSESARKKQTGFAIVSSLLSFLIFFCVLLWLLGWGLGPLRTDRLQATFTFVLLALLVRVAQQTFFQFPKHRFQNALALGLGAAVGYSPKLVYQWLGGTSMGRTQVGGRFADVVNRLEWFSQGWGQALFGIQPSGWLCGAIFLVLVLAIGLGIWTDRKARPLSPFLLLPVTNLAACLAGSAFVAPNCIWYFVPAFAGLAVVFTRLVAWVGQVARPLGAILAAAYLGHGAYLLSREVLSANPIADMAYELTYMHVSKASAARALAEAAEANGLVSGYADYDFAYAATLLTTERVNVAPLQSSFLPWIAEKARAEERFFTVTAALGQPFVEGQLLKAVRPLVNPEVLSSRQTAVLEKSDRLVLDGRAWDFLVWRLTSAP